MTEKKIKKVFVDGTISTIFIGESIAKHSSRKDIGAHSIFLGQVRNDLIDGKEVKAIDYTSYNEMAEEKFHEIREAIFEKFSYDFPIHDLFYIKCGSTYCQCVDRNQIFCAVFQRKIITDQWQ